MNLTKSPRLEMPKLLKLANGMPCQHCGCQDGTVVMAHSDFSIHGKGKGIKAHDCFVAALCGNCHDWLGHGIKPCGAWQATREEKLEFFRRAMKSTMLYFWRNGLVTIA